MEEIKEGKWYRQKRYWLLLLLAVWLLLAYSEQAKMRYQPAALAENLKAAGQQSVVFRSKQVDGHQLHYLEMIQADSLPLVVFVHGSPGALSAYETYLADTTFSRCLNMIAIDRPGFGYSDFGSAELSLEMQARQLAAVLAEFSDVPKIAVGHSMGGPVIAKTAMLYPDLLNGLVMVAPAVSPTLEPSAEWRKILNIIPLRWLTPPAFRVCNQEIIPLREELENMLPDWQKLSLPITVIQGEEDVLVPAGNASFIVEAAPNSTYMKVRMMEGGDHFILWSERFVVQSEIQQIIQLVTTIE